MLLAFFDFEEVLEWMDVFSGVTGLSCSESASVLADLTAFYSASEMFSEVAARQKYRAGLDAAGEALYDEETVSMLDDRMDDDEVSRRFSYYKQVMMHRGFSEEFYKLFRLNLSPTSEYPPRTFSIDKASVFSTSFNQTPFVGSDEVDGENDEDDEDDEDDEFDPAEFIEGLLAGGIASMGEIRLSRPVNPVGWMKMMEHLGFEVRPVSPIPVEPWYPKFFAYKDAVRHPVFVAGPSKLPFDDDDDLTTYIKEEIRKHTLINKHDVPLLFWSTPVTSGDDNLPYWGEVQFENKWYEMFMSDAVKTVADIVKVSKIMSKHSEQGYKEASALLADKDLKLVGFFMDNHVDPLTKIIESAIGKYKD